MAHKNVKPLVIALGATLSVAGAVNVQAADANPFSLTELSSGYMTQGPEGSCGEGKCGGEKPAEASCGEGKCGGEKPAEASCGEGKCGGEKPAEASCGEGKCGGAKPAEGSCGEGKAGEGSCGEAKGGEGKCGEGKCGGDTAAPAEPEKEKKGFWSRLFGG